jgi:hypothetical protein
MKAMSERRTYVTLPLRPVPDVPPLSSPAQSPVLRMVPASSRDIPVEHEAPIAKQRRAPWAFGLLVVMAAIGVGLAVTAVYRAGIARAAASVGAHDQ